YRFDLSPREKAFARVVLWQLPHRGHRQPVFLQKWTDGLAEELCLTIDCRWASASGEAVLDVLVDHLLSYLDDAFATERFQDPPRRAVGLRRESEMRAYLRERTNTAKLVVSQQRRESIGNGDTPRLGACHRRVPASSRSQFVALCLQDFARLFHISLARALTDKTPAMANR